ncbi:MAG TPA: PD-(D/E)XK nuclease family protein [Candidatus Saccharimonadales bacterium]|nr:PD-(D/E)XK nuclease family protein [Candidatus Saccharimonadales bacterium]
MAYNRRTAPYRPGQKEAFKISRSKIELYMQCPRCFWLDARLKLRRPSGPPFRINTAIDELLKKEFDGYRLKKKPHPIMKEFGVAATPFAHDELDNWRQNFVGVQHLHEDSNFLVTGAIDDVWGNEYDELFVVDYKATAKQADVTIDADWQIAYKRQMEVYQWLLRQNGFKVNDTGYFVYANGRLDLDGFYNKVEFKTKIIPYKGDDSWVDKTLMKMKKSLEGGMPAVGKAAMGGPCDFCEYARNRTELTLSHIRSSQNKT